MVGMVGRDAWDTFVQPTNITAQSRASYNLIRVQYNYDRLHGFR